MEHNKAVFLDRDGTICTDVNYCSSPDDFKLLPGAAEAISRLNHEGYKVILITNQSGIARGYFTEETLKQIHDEMEKQLAESGAVIDAVYYCPHHPDEECDCRKPKPGMLEQAIKDYSIDVSQSYMIGDHQKDIEAGKAVGCRTILVKTGPDGGRSQVNPEDHSTDTLADAVDTILHNEV